MKAVVLDVAPYLPRIFAVLVYDTNTVCFLLMCCNAIEWVNYKRQVYDPKTEMVCDDYFLRLNVNNSYNNNMKLVDLSDKICNVYRVDH